MNNIDILTMRQAADLLRIPCSTKNPTRKVKRFLEAIQNKRGIPVLFQTKQQYYTTGTALRKAVPEFFAEEGVSSKFDANHEDVKEDISEETLELVKELIQDMKDQMKKLRGRNKQLQEQLVSLNNKYQDLEDKYNKMSVKIYLNQKAI